MAGAGDVDEVMGAGVRVYDAPMVFGGDRLVRAGREQDRRGVNAGCVCQRIQFGGICRAIGPAMSQSPVTLSGSGAIYGSVLGWSVNMTGSSNVYLRPVPARRVEYRHRAMRLAGLLSRSLPPSPARGGVGLAPGVLPTS